MQGMTIHWQRFVVIVIEAFGIGDIQQLETECDKQMFLSEQTHEL